MKLSNGISLSRLVVLGTHLLIAPFIAPWINTLIVVGNYLSDSLDGFVARRRGGTRYGEFMDISVDRIITLSYFSYHLWNRSMGLWFFLLVLGRNIFGDYIAHFKLIESKQTERHKTTKGVAYWIYSSKASKIINGGLQLLISSWGFFGAVPLWLELLFVINSYVRVSPTLISAKGLI